MSQITNLYTLIYNRALATGETRRIDLKGGARLAVRVRRQDDGDHVAFTIARKGKHVGSTEEVVFKRDCNVPAGAVREPEKVETQVVREIDGETWYLVGYRWVAAAEGGAT